MAVSSVAAPSPPADAAANAPLAERLFPNNEWVLLLVIVIECAIFSLTGNNFLSATNAFEITRLSVEIGLLALAYSFFSIRPASKARRPASTANFIASAIFSASSAAACLVIFSRHDHRRRADERLYP